MEQGTIVQRIGGFCYVLWEKQIYTCKARGRLRQDALAIIPGDYVLFDPKERIVEKLLPRQTSLIRPQIANVEQVVVVFACMAPPVDFMLLDRLLITATSENLKTIVCFNKCDLPIDPRTRIYEKIGYTTIFTSTMTGEGIENLQEQLSGKISCLAGPSGVGKSALLNCIIPGAQLQIGSISPKMQRGRHTTRSVELLALPNQGLVADTPGFSQLSLYQLVKENLASYFPEMASVQMECHYNGCLHDHEPKCAVKQAVEQKDIAQLRYDHYLTFLQEIKDYDNRRY